MRQESKNNLNDREVHERRRIQNGHSIKKQFDHSRTQEISHILSGEQLNVFNGEESMSYLQLPVKKKEGKPLLYQMWRNGDTEDVIVKSTHGAKFCITDTHATQASRKYEKFVKDNPIASSRRNTPVQTQGQRATVNPQERPQQPLFPHSACAML